jgi:arabinan endo-1,5-alpha-L-arabinosidase
VGGTDGKNWKSAPNIFPNGLPSEVQSAVPDNDGVWAPDVIYNPNSGLYDLYYAVAVWGNSDYSLIGLITSPTVDPTCGCRSGRATDRTRARR